LSVIPANFEGYELLRGNKAPAPHIKGI
jgi:hypothetical protein